MNQHKPLEPIVCLNCGEEFIRLDSVYSRFCSEECRSQWEVHDRRLLFERDDNRCVYCGKAFDDTTERPGLDHIVPRSKGGTAVAANLVTVCSSCNSRKGSKMLPKQEIARLWKDTQERNLISGINPEMIVRVAEA